MTREKQEKDDRTPTSTPKLFLLYSYIQGLIHFKVHWLFYLRS